MTIPDVDLADALRASRERYRALLLAALDCVVAMDHHGRVLEWNPAAERTFGYRASEAIGREMAELIVPPALRDAPPRRARALPRRRRAGVLDQRLEITAVRADGERVPGRADDHPHRPRRATPSSPATCATSPTASRAEAELRASRARIVDAADAARRRLERDLHDGAQQRLVALR